MLDDLDPSIYGFDRSIRDALALNIIKAIDDLTPLVTQHPGNFGKFSNIIQKEFGDKAIYPAIGVLRGGSRINEIVTYPKKC